MTTMNMTVSVPLSQRERLEAEAEATGRKYSTIVQRALAAYFASQDQDA